jgi:hypothetical protein
MEETASACRPFSSLLSPPAAHTINGKGVLHVIYKKDKPDVQREF